MTTLLAIVAFLVIAATAQRKDLPSNLSPNSTAPQIIYWLDEFSFAKARIGLSVEVDDESVDISQLYEMPLSEWAVFSNGFRLKSFDKCKLTLRNDDVDLLYFSTGSYNLKNVRLGEYLDAPKLNIKYYAEIIVPLNYISLTKGKRPFLLTKKVDKARKLGAWRTMFRLRQPSFFSVIRGRHEPPDPILIGIRSRADETFYDSMKGDTLTFTFDEKDMSEQFYAAFRRTIELCAPK